MFLGPENLGVAWPGSSDSGSFLRVQPDAGWGCITRRLATGRRIPFQRGSFPWLPSGWWPGASFPRQRSVRVSLSPQSRQSLETAAEASVPFITARKSHAVISALHHGPGSYNGPLRLKGRGHTPHISLPVEQWQTDFNKTMWDGTCLDAAIFGKYICYSKFHKYTEI